MAGYSDLDRQIEQLKRCEIIKEAEVKTLCARAREIMVEESNVQSVDSPVTVQRPRHACPATRCGTTPIRDNVRPLSSPSPKLLGFLFFALDLW